MRQRAVPCVCAGARHRGATAHPQPRLLRPPPPPPPLAHADAPQKTHHNIVRQLREDRAAKAKKELADVVNSETAKLQAATARASAKAKEAIAAARDEVTERYDDLCAALKVAAGAAPGGDLDAALAQLLASSEAAVEGKTAAVEAVAGTAAERVRKVLEEDAGKVEAQFAALAEAERAKAERELARQIVQLEVRARAGLLLPGVGGARVRIHSKRRHGACSAVCCTRLPRPSPPSAPLSSCSPGPGASATAARLSFVRARRKCTSSWRRRCRRCASWPCAMAPVAARRWTWTARRTRRRRTAATSSAQAGRAHAWAPRSGSGDAAGAARAPQLQRRQRPSRACLGCRFTGSCVRGGRESEGGRVQ